MKKMYIEQDIFAANDYRRRYLNGIYEYIEMRTKICDEVRKREITPERMQQDIEYYRGKYIEMLGCPLTEYKHNIPEAEQKYIGEDDYCNIYRVSIQTIETIPFYGILCIPKLSVKKYPLLILQHGGGGTPELLCDMHGENNYSHISKIALENGFAVFAPQLLLWNFRVGDRLSYGEDMNFSRADIDGKLKQRGGSITALEIYNIRKAVDYLETLDVIEKDKIGMMGLSYGGYFTLYTAAADKRIRAAYVSAAFNDRNQEVKFMDWRYQGSALQFYDAEVAGLCAPRPLFIEVGEQDSVFRWESAVLEAKRAKQFYEVYGEKSALYFQTWAGEHRINVGGPYLKTFFDVLKGE